MKETAEQIVKTITWNINVLRGRKRWTQHDLADRAGLSDDQLSRILGGKYAPRIATLVALANALGVSAATLLTKTK